MGSRHGVPRLQSALKSLSKLALLPLTTGTGHWAAGKNICIYILSFFDDHIWIFSSQLVNTNSLFFSSFPVSKFQPGSIMSPEEAGKFQLRQGEGLMEEGLADQGLWVYNIQNQSAGWRGAPCPALSRDGPWDKGNFWPACLWYLCRFQLGTSAFWWDFLFLPVSFLSFINSFNFFIYMHEVNVKLYYKTHEGKPHSSTFHFSPLPRGNNF